MVPYGSFAPDGREYVISDPATPRPWANYLTNGHYCALISQTGGGYSFFGSSGYHRVTRAHPADMLVSDRPGRYLYLRDEDTGDVWSPGWQPVQAPYDHWECHHGLGYTTIHSVAREMEAHVTFFVPRGEDLEIWWVRLTNRSARPRTLSVFSYLEWALGSFPYDLLETAFASLFKRVEWSDTTLVAENRLWEVAARPTKPHLAWPAVAFTRSSLPVTSFDGLRAAFVGPGRYLSRPVAVERGQCSNSQGPGQDAVGVLHSSLHLEPGETREFVIVVGAASDRASAARVSRKYLDLDEVRRALAHVRGYWDDYVGHLWASTPDGDFDLALNIWSKYQSWVTFQWSRMVSYYIGGGSVIGFRDSCQDLLGILPMEPEAAARKLRELLRHQFPDGGCLHNWDPVSDTGPRTGHSDDALWPVLAVIAYLKETGDLEFLHEVVPFYGGGEGTIHDHLERSLSYTLSRLSPRGIPLMGAADWNDGLDQVGTEGRGESVMTAEFFVWMLREMAALEDHLGNRDQAGHYRTRADEISRAVNEHCWDGEWYIRGTTDRGEAFGSHLNRWGRIYVNAQTWAVLSDLAPPDRALAAMESVWKHLDTPYGPALFLPAYQEPDHSLGIITMFAPGTKENGAIFNHPVTWAILAEARLGRGDRAYDWFRKSCFVRAAADQDRYLAEPYVYAEYVHGPGSPWFGRGEFTWTTGTAAWAQIAGYQGILGARPELGGLRVDPVIPPGWDGFNLRRTFRRATYLIEVGNPGHVSRGVQKVYLDGQELPGNLVPPLEDGKEHRVRVLMGPA